MHITPRRHFRPLSSLFLAMALGCTGAPMEPGEAESALSSEAQSLSLASGLRPALVKDIQVGSITASHVEKGSYWSTTSSFRPALPPVVIGSTAYFAAHEETTGLEIWRTDGTPEGTRLVRELTPGPGIGGLSGFVAVGDTLYASSETGRDSGILWKSDGTTRGTHPVAMPTGVRAPGNLASCAGQLFFQNYRPELGSSYWTGLWKSDGTPEGTVQLSASVQAIRTNPPRFACADGTLFFMTTSKMFGDELWKSDGTPAGTVSLKRVNPILHAWEGSPDLVTVGSRVLINTGFSGLWASDGTPEGTQLLEGAGLPERYSHYFTLTRAGDTAYFVSTAGYGIPALWASDGTPAGTRRLMESYGLPYAQFQALGDTLLFSIGPVTYRSNGTPEGTVAVDELDLLRQPGVGAVLPDGRWLLSGNPIPSTSYDASVWVSDGTQAGRTRLQSSTGQGPLNARRLTRLGDRVLFWADDGAHGLEPWVTDGTSEGTRMLRDIYRADSAWPASLTDVDGALYFTASNATQGRDLWKSDGTTEGTFLVRNLASAPERLTNVQGTLFFFQPATGPTSPATLWKSDGTEGGTVPFYTLPGGTPSFNEVGRLGASFVFATSTSAQGRELWKSDGTAEGTVLVKDLRPGTGSSTPNTFTRVGDTLFFVADDGVHGRELWKTDGTAEGTVLVKDVRPGTGPSAPGNLQAAGSTLFFLADDGVHGRELWKTDGTAEGTVLVKDLRPIGSSFLLSTAALGETLFFSTSDGLHGNELWKSDGTAQGTVLVKDIVPGAGSSMLAPLYAVAIADTLYFQADDGVHGAELWKTDGTAEGTVLVKDLVPGAVSGLLNMSLTAVGSRGHFAFPAVNDVGSPVLWLSNGTAEGTQPVDGSPISPMAFEVSGSRLFFIADEGEHGMELWSLKQGAYQQPRR